MDGGKAVLLNKSFRDQNGIFEVATFPGKERHNDVLTESQLTAFCRRRVGDNIAFLDPLSLYHCRALIDAGTLIRSLILAQLVYMTTASFFDGNRVAGHRGYLTIGVCHDNLTGVQRGMILHSRRNQRDLGTNEWNCLRLHV